MRNNDKNQQYESNKMLLNSGFCVHNPSAADHKKTSLEKRSVARCKNILSSSVTVAWRLNGLTCNPKKTLKQGGGRVTLRGCLAASQMIARRKKKESAKLEEQTNLYQYACNFSLSAEILGREMVQNQT